MAKSHCYEWTIIIYITGLFCDVHHVMLVGVGGAVPNFADVTKHVRLGDIVVSTPQKKDGPIYVHCDKVEPKEGRWRCTAYHQWAFPASWLTSHPINQYHINNPSLWAVYHGNSHWSVIDCISW